MDFPFRDVFKKCLCFLEIVYSSNKISNTQSSECSLDLAESQKDNTCATFLSIAITYKSVGALVTPASEKVPQSMITTVSTQIAIIQIANRFVL